jgi:RNA polymerase sigma-70 factor, ECF subfamily
MTAAAKLSKDLRAIYEAEVSNVSHSLRRLGARSADLDDLTQEVFVRALKQIDRFDPARPIRPWLFGIALRVLSEAKRDSWMVKEVREGESEEVADPRVTPEQATEVNQDRALVLSAIQELVPERRAVFVMYELNGHSMSEIADTFAIPLFTAYSRLRVARTQFAAAVRRLRREARGGRHD